MAMDVGPVAMEAMRAEEELAVIVSAWSGGKDAKAMLWDLNDGKHLYTLDHADTINALTFSPNRYWLCAATGPTIKIWDLESKNMVEELRPEVPGTARADPPQCLSL